MKTVVIGHNSPDIDSIASAIIMADFLNKKGTDAKAYIGEGYLVTGTQEILDYLNIKLPPKHTQKLINNPTVIVDFNNPEIGPKNLKNIVNLIDHHTETDWAKKIKTKHIERVGATSTLVSEKFLEEFEFNTLQAKLLLFAIIYDTQNLTHIKTCQRDIDMVKKLESLSGLKAKKVVRLIKGWSTFKFNKNKIVDYLHEDTKKGVIKGYRTISAVVMAKNYKPFYKNHKLIENNFDKMEDADIKSFVVQDLKRKKTIIIHNSVIDLPSPIFKEKVMGRRQVKEYILKHA